MEVGSQMSDVDVVGTGFTVLDRVYSGACKTIAEELGGSCGNILISLATLRRNVAPVLSLGDDEVGTRLVMAFRHAGAETRYIRRGRNLRSPILAQHLDEVSGHHSFAFRCPETGLDLPRYTPIEEVDVERARSAIRKCSVFYTDRLSLAIVEAMELAARAGSLVFFEPSEITDERLFRRALTVTAVLKLSADRLDPPSSREGVSDTAIVITTHGEAGLEVRRGGERRWCISYPASHVRDTCGAGDMVSVGIIDRLLANGRYEAGSQISFREILEGVEAGQRLAAANCAFVGARGLFRERGPTYARSVLEG